MAKKIYRKHYRMTPARRAALRKAQLASARRRKKNKKIAGTAVGVLAVTALVGNAGIRRGRAKRSKNIVDTIKNNSIDSIHPSIKISKNSKEIDLHRYTIEDYYGEFSQIDYGKIGDTKPRKNIAFIRRKRTRGKPNTHSRGRRVIEVYPDGSTGPIGWRARQKEQKRMNYSPKARKKSYEEAKNRPTPPPWLNRRKT